MSQSRISVHGSMCTDTGLLLCRNEQCLMTVWCVSWLPYMHMGVFLGLPALCFSHATFHSISWYSWTEYKTLCLHLTASEGTPASVSLSHGYNFMPKDPYHRWKNMKSDQTIFQILKLKTDICMLSTILFGAQCYISTSSLMQS